jgi:multimeric flavodoxin WrbA
MERIVFMNGSPNKRGNTFRIREEILKGVSHDILQMADYKVNQYDQVYEDDQMSEIFKKIENVDTIVIGSPVYWYTVSGMVKTFIDRLYLLPEAEILKGKNLYFFAQGSAPDEATVKSIIFLASRVSELMGMNLKSVVVDSSDGSKIINTMHITE